MTQNSTLKGACRLVAVLSLLFTAPAAFASHSESHILPVLSEHHIGLGFATSQNITASSTAITGWIDLSPRLGIQPFFSIPQTSPFQFSAAGILKYTVVEQGSAGFHVGGGLGISDIPKVGGHAFGLSISGVGGFHFAVPGASNILVHLDGGPVFTIIDGDSNFHVDSVSPALGLSVIYVF